MPFELTVNKSEMGSGTVYIHGLGEFTNGTHEISDEQEQNFRLLNMTEDSYNDQDPESPTFGSFIHSHDLGPSLIEAAESMHGVTVRESSTSSRSNRSGPVGAGASVAPVDNDKTPPEGDDH